MRAPRINDSGIYRTMGRSAIIILVVVLLDGVSGEYADSSGTQNFASRNLDGNVNGLCSGANCAERGSGVSGAMWFGPRLGRRRRSDEKPEAFDDDQINTIADVLQAAPWTLVSIQGSGDKRHTNQFTPRLGRESGEEFLQKLLMGENSRLGRLIDSDDILDERQSPPPPPPPFAPRLGRRLPFTPSPRLGRRLRALFQKL